MLSPPQRGLLILSIAFMLLTEAFVYVVAYEYSIRVLKYKKLRSSKQADWTGRAIETGHSHRI